MKRHDQVDHVPLSKLLSLGIFLLLFLPPALGAAAARTNAAERASNRWLLVVETSRSMQPRRQAVAKALQDLLDSSMRGQFQPGDTIGFWTFNQEVYLGRFPLQTWTKKSAAEIGSQVLSFLNEQKFEKAANLGKMFPELAGVIRDSGLITVIMITSGENPIEGTPFDQQANAVFQQWDEHQRNERLPFVTVLRAERGTISTCAVTPSPWPVEIPALPPKPAPVVVEKKPQPPPKPKPATAPPLIISGKKTDPEAAKQRATPTESLRSETTAVASNLPPAPASATASTQPAPAPTTVAGNVAPSGEPAHQPPQSVAKPVTPPVEQRESPNVTQPISATDDPLSTRKPPAKAASVTAPAQGSPPPPSTQAAVSKQTHETATVPAVKRAEPTPVPEPGPPRNESPEPIPTAPLATATAAAPSRLAGALLIWGVAGTLAGTAFALTLFLMRRSRVPHVSLITKSLDREQR